MKIMCDRLSDLIEKRNELINRYDQQLETNTIQDRKYQDAKEAVLAPIQQYLDHELSKFDLIKFNTYIHYSEANNTAECIITNKVGGYTNKIALIWTINIVVDIQTGEVKKESNSWHGLQACTSDQIEYLQQCVDAIKFINNLDWFELFNRQYPNYSDYFGQLEDIDIHQYDNEIFKEELKRFQESRTLLRGKENVKGKYYDFPAYFVDHVTDNSVTLREILDPTHSAFKYTPDKAYSYASAQTRRVSLSRLDKVLKVPLDPVPDDVFK